MAAERPEKTTMRSLWVEEVCRADSTAAPARVPLYLTLAGAQGRDIQALVDRGVLELTETGAVENVADVRVVAIERSANALVELAKRFPGLKIIDQSLDALLHSTGALTWPRGEHHQLFRAQVINLDLEEPLKARTQEGQLSFPSLALIRKVATIHAAEPCVEWTLCLTLHGEVAWTQEQDTLACRFLAENFARDEQFAADARAALGNDLYEAIATTPASAKVRSRSRAEQQRVLCALVPKRIAYEAHALGWKVTTTENLRYGGSGQRAPMATWIMRFEWDPRASAEPDTVYREALALTLRKRGRIDSHGVLHREGDVA